MSKHACRSCWLPGALFLFALLSLATAPSRGDLPADREADVLVVEQSFPEPPRQHDDWKAPASTVPNEFVTAAWLLFQYGFADPRGCDYREIEVTTGWPTDTDGGVTRTHGWVLPAKDTGSRRFAVCWNGLIRHDLSGRGRASRRITGD